MGRAPCCSKVGLHRGPWTAREDMLLTKFIEAHGEGQWRALPKKAGLLRCGKSCRLRWMNYLRPDIKRGNITPDEEELIVRMHRLLGNRWSLIAGRLPGRTDNEIKNFWNTHLSKKLMKKGLDPKTHQPLSNRKGAEKSTGFGENYTRKKKDMDSDRKNVSEGHVQQVHLPKANRYIAFPRSQSTPNLSTLGFKNGLEVQHGNDVLLSSSIDLNSCCLSSLNSSQDSELSSPKMLSHLDPTETLLPEQDNNLLDCFQWPCIEEEEDWTVSNFQPTEGGSLIPTSCSVEDRPKDDDAKRISSISGNDYDPSQSKLSHMHRSKQEKSSNVLLQKVYEEYLGLLQEDLAPNNNDSNNHENLISDTPPRNNEDIRAFPEGLSSVWDCLQQDDNDEDLLKQENDVSEPPPLH